MKRVAHLDGIRGIAVALVVLHHWTATGHAMDFGNIGVQLFFVLSGFLITGILLDTRAAYESGSVGLGIGLGDFWKRRAARILPVFLLTLTLIYLAGNRFEKPENMTWHFLFASNLLFFMRGQFDSNLAHFWTLAVEQQFYLAWPLAVMFAPRRWLERLMLALVALAPATRMALYVAGFREFSQFNVLPLASFDSLGFGALVALWMRMPAEQARPRWSALSVCAVVATVAFVANCAFGRLPANMEQSFYAVIFAWLVGASSRQQLGGLAGKLLESRPLVALGIVSYGVYVYHVFGPRFVGAGLRAIDAPSVLHSGVPLFLLSAILTLAAACLSWFLMERPIIRSRRNRISRPPPVKLDGVDDVVQQVKSGD